MASNNMKLLCSQLLNLRLNKITSVRTYYSPPKYRPPYWYQPKSRVLTDELLTQENKQFIEEIMQDRMKAQSTTDSPLIQHEHVPNGQWTPYTRRVGVIARKIGNYPLWTKDGKKKQTTLLQVIDNHVIKYIPPGEYNPMIMKSKKFKTEKKFGCLLVGAETIDPSLVTKNYNGIFSSVGMMPKQHLFRFLVSPEAALPTGTPLYATHFRVGDHIDIRAKTIDRGFQGVIKRWGFKGMPASHGVTKTHRRPGNIGAGGQKARVWPGTKMPGHMGNRWRVLRGVKILRMNTEHNVIWALGVAIPGETGAVCYLYDTVLPLRRHQPAAPPPFPTHTPTDDLPPELYDDSLHDFTNSSITYEES